MRKYKGTRQPPHIAEELLLRLQKADKPVHEGTGDADCGLHSETFPTKIDSLDILLPTSGCFCS
jgi:hypothetical protein